MSPHSYCNVCIDICVELGVFVGVCVGDGESELVKLGVCDGVGVDEVDRVGDGVGLTPHDGCMPLTHAQLPSAPPLAKTLPVPVAGAAHEKAYEVAPADGAAGTTAVKAKAASGGCESATTSVEERLRE